MQRREREREKRIKECRADGKEERREEKRFKRREEMR
jgi:hypothetical protein